MRNEEFNSWLDRNSWLEDLPPSVIAIPIASNTFTHFIFLTGSFIRFTEKHNISDIKAAIILRKLVNETYKFDEAGVKNWYKETVLSNFDLENIEINVNLNCLDLKLSMSRFRRKRQFKGFVESTINFVSAL